MFENDKYSIPHLTGKVAVSVDSFPTLRGSVRRTDPDGGSTVPYYSGVSGKILSLAYADSGGGPLTQNITIPSNGYAAIITYINTLDPANLQALDQDGFLALRDLNEGGVSYIKVTPQGDPSTDAAPILGFRVDPFPGSKSIAGEISSSPANRKQSNPQGTELIAKDEDLTSSAINRAILSVAKILEREIRNLDKELITFAQNDTVVSAHNNTAIGTADGFTSGVESLVANVFVLNDPSIRIPLSAFGINSATPTSDQLDKLFSLIDKNKISDLIKNENRYGINSVHYASGVGATLNRSSTFVAWGTPDGKSIFGGSSLWQKDKHAAVAITSIDGNIIYCSGATFSDKFVQPGDTLVIQSATNDQPFSHNGEFIVDEVIDNKHVAVRPKSVDEALVFSLNTPTALNPVPGSGSLGSVKIPIGFFLPASNLVLTYGPRLTLTAPIEVAGDSGKFPLALRYATGQRLRNVLQSLALGVGGRPEPILSYILGHIDSSHAHDATAIVVSSAPVWALTSETLPESTIQGVVQRLIDMLGDNETFIDANTGASRVGSAALTATAPDDVPNSLSAGSVKSQLLALLTDLNHHINDGSAHGGGATFTAVADWFDTTTLTNGETINAAINEIVSDLAVSSAGSGAEKVGANARSSWRGGRTNPAGVSVLAALTKIINDLGVQTAADDGASRIGAQVTANNTAGSVRSQLDELAANWGKLNRNQVWTADQIFNGSAGDDNSAISTSSVPITRKLLWDAESGNGSPTVVSRFYATVTGGFEFTVNAQWDAGSTQWLKDNNAKKSSKISFDYDNINVYAKTPGAGLWADGAWTNNNCTISISGAPGIITLTDGEIDIGDESIATASPIKNKLIGRTICKVQGTIRLTGTAGTATAAAIDGINIAGVTMSSASVIRVTFAQAFANNTFAPVMTVGPSSDVAFNFSAHTPVVTAKDPSGTYVEFYVVGGAGPSAQSWTTGSGFTTGKTFDINIHVMGKQT